MPVVTGEHLVGRVGSLSVERPGGALVALVTAANVFVGAEVLEDRTAGGGDLDGDGLPVLVVAGAERLFAFSGRDGALLRALCCGPRREWLAQEQYVRIAGRSLENAVGLLPGRGAEGRAGIAFVVVHGDDRMRQ